ncbi:hypothetical protein K505DRAFT_324682 [Melanomma pulvis-pyrius CBS 109.77]|uniref:NHL repeat-containing protein n=1 Tax=Melanomma pulvis-pyrius CBS 109.77 TaxID=1314802 RepID=A0A6A6XE09_9PLEO|nr:hypothetical protein K505DRAFT_324682 [Melanomma pulvis-pyrius CBS 109.77]
MRFLTSTSATTTLLTSLLLTPAVSSPLSSTPAKSKTIFQFPNPTWIENISATRNGSLLVSLIGAPELHLVHPSTSPPTASLVHRFPGADSLLGITEYAPDVFAVITSNYSLTTGATIGSSSVWSVDLTPCTTATRKAGAGPLVRKIADLPTAQVLNGAAALNPHTVLLADSFAGTVVALDVRTGSYATALDDESLKPTGTGPVIIGVNGLKVRDGYLYYTNTLHGTFSRVKVHPVTGKAVGPFTQIAAFAVPDDFAFARDGTAYVARPLANEVVAVKGSAGVVRTVVGNLNSSAVAGVTSVTVGRGKGDAGVVYVGTNGGLSGPVNGTFTEGGKVVGIWV